MRDLLDAILEFIGVEVLTDQEFDSLPEDLSTDELKYEALHEVLVDRESISTSKDRLRYYFLAMGVSVEAIPVAASNIYLGDAL